MAAAKKPTARRITVRINDVFVQYGARPVVVVALDGGSAVVANTRTGRRSKVRTSRLQKVYLRPGEREATMALRDLARVQRALEEERRENRRDSAERYRERAKRS